MPSHSDNSSPVTSWGSDETKVFNNATPNHSNNQPTDQSQRETECYAHNKPFLYLSRVSSSHFITPLSRAFATFIKSIRHSMRPNNDVDLESQRHNVSDPEKTAEDIEQNPGNEAANLSQEANDDGVTSTVVRHLEKCPEGYSRLAAFNASEQNFMLYRGFSYVHARLLLDLQTEIADLEGQLDELDKFDQRMGKSGLLKSRTRDIVDAREFEAEQAHEPAEQRQATRRTILEKLQEKVSRYDDLLIKCRELTSFQRPSDRDYRSVRNWFYTFRPVVEKEEGYIKCREDIVTLRHGREWAGFDGMIETMLYRLDCPLIRKLFCTPDLRRKTTDRNLHYFSPSRVEKLVDFIITCIIFILLVIPVVAMYRLTNLGTGNSIFSAIGVLIVFTLLFAAAMSLLTKSKRHELFAASAAYCAVLVVFIENFN